MRPVASMVRAACTPAKSPTAAMRSPETATSARWRAAPVPSITVPPMKRTSYLLFRRHRRLPLSHVVGGLYLMAQLVNRMRHLVTAAARQARSLAPGARPTRWNQLR